jgi:hypothetical protein
MNFLRINLWVLLCILGIVVGGCGSDSGSGSPAVKKEKKSPAGQPAKVVELLTDKDKVRETSAIPARPGPMERKDIPVIPPGKAGGKGLTQAEVEARQAKSATMDPKSRPVIPPAKPGAKSVTQGEIEAMRARGPASGRSEVIPPPAPGGRGMSEQELNALRTKSRGAGESPSIEVIPPSSPGGRGVTQREVNALRPAASSTEAPVVPGPEVSRVPGKGPATPGASPAVPAFPSEKSR